MFTGPGLKISQVFLSFSTFRDLSQIFIFDPQVVVHWGHSLPLPLLHQPKDLLKNETKQSILRQVLMISKFIFVFDMKMTSHQNSQSSVRCFSVPNSHLSSICPPHYIHINYACKALIRNRSSSAKKAGNLATILILIGGYYCCWLLLIVDHFCYCEQSCHNTYPHRLDLLQVLILVSLLIVLIG